MIAAVWLLVLLGLLAYLLYRGERRVALAFALAPLTSPVITTIETRDVHTFLFMSLVSYPFSLLLGVPAYVVFHRLRWLQGWRVVLTCGVLGGAADLVTFGIPNYPGATKSLLTFCALGAATGLVFWVIAFVDLRSNNRWRVP